MNIMWTFIFLFLQAPAAPTHLQIGISGSGKGTFDYMWAPSLQDERNTYRSWGWTWSPSDEPNYPADTLYSVTKCIPHEDTEGDDLYETLAMYRRTVADGHPQAGYLSRATAWADYYINRWWGTNSATYGEGIRCHHYGWGLLEWWKYTGDPAALAMAETVADDIDGYWRGHENGSWPSPNNPWEFWYYGNRSLGRQLLLAVRLASATRTSRWIQLRDNMLNSILTAPNWDAKNGIYWCARDSTNSYKERLSDGTYLQMSYENGDRITSSNMDADLAEALWEAYLATGDQRIPPKLTGMAEFYYQHGHDPLYDYATGWQGIHNGTWWWKTTGFIPNGWCSLHIVDILVYGYKLTGNAKYLEFAKHAFDRGSKAVYNSWTKRNATPTTPYGFIDTKFGLGNDAGQFLLAKGELQYCRYLFENGGSPTVMNKTSSHSLGWSVVANTRPALVAPTNGTWYSFNSSSRNVVNAWGGGVYDTQRNRLWFWGGGHGDYFGNELYYYDVGAQRTVRYNDPSPDTTFPKPVPSGADTYSDGRPCSRHTYHHIDYLPIQDRLFMYGGSKAGGSGGFGKDVWWFDPDNVNGGLGGWEPKGILSNNPGPAMVAVHWDGDIRKLWMLDLLAGEHTLRQYDPVTNSFSVIKSPTGSATINVNVSTGFDPVSKTIFIVGNGYFGTISVAPGSNYALVTRTTTGGEALVNSKAPGLAYDPVIKKMVGWNIIAGRGDTVYTLDTKTWAWAKQTFSNGPVPTGAYPNASGQYGRFQYSSLIDAFVAISDWQSDVHILRTR